MAVVLMNKHLISWDDVPYAEKFRFRKCYVQVKLGIVEDVSLTFCTIFVTTTLTEYGNQYMPLRLTFFTNASNYASDATFHILNHKDWEFGAPAEHEAFLILLNSVMSEESELDVIKDNSQAGGSPYYGNKAFKIPSTYAQYQDLALLAGAETGADSYHGVLECYLVRNNETVAVNNFPAVQDVNIGQVNAVAIGNNLPIDYKATGGLAVVNNAVPVEANVWVQNFPAIQNVQEQVNNRDVVISNFPPVMAVNIEQVNAVEIGNNLPIDYKATDGNIVVNGNVPVNIARISNVPASYPLTVDVTKTGSIALVAGKIPVQEQAPLAAVAVNNLPAVQGVNITHIAGVGVGTSNLPVAVNNFPAVQNVLEQAPLAAVAVNNLPAIQDINIKNINDFPVNNPNGILDVTGSLSVDNFPAEQAVNIMPNLGADVAVVITNFPAVQNVLEQAPLAAVSVNNFPAVQNVLEQAPLAAVEVSNFPVTQDVNIQAVNPYTGALAINIDQIGSLGIPENGVLHIREVSPLAAVAVNNFPAVQNVLEQAPLAAVAVNNFPDPNNVNIVSDQSGIESTTQEYINK